MDGELGHKILDKLDTLVKLSAYNIVKDKEFKEQVRILSESGLQPKDIADLLDKTPNNVRVTLSSVRKEKKAK